MTKFDYIFSNRNLPKSYSNKHAIAILDFINKNSKSNSDINFSVYKNLVGKDYILKCDKSMIASFKNARELCEFLLPLYEKTKEQKQEEIFNNLFMRSFK